MKCPKCDQIDAEELFEEVDIGVGVQKHVFGCECKTCGIIGICPHCDAWDFQLHAAWCADAGGN